MNDRKLTSESDHVRKATHPEVLEQIDQQIEETVRLYDGRDRELISRRIEKLDREWDIERLLESNASSLAGIGLLLGIARGRKWFLLTGGVLGFLLQHALQGWCPPIPLLRRLGFRTRREIDREKFALKVLRGDFSGLQLSEAPLNGSHAKDVLRAVGD